MGIGEFVSVVALFISAFALWLGWQADVTNKGLRDELLELYRREANRVDTLIEYLIARRGDSS